MVLFPLCSERSNVPRAEGWLLAALCPQGQPSSERWWFAGPCSQS